MPVGPLLVAATLAQPSTPVEAKQKLAVVNVQLVEIDPRFEPLLTEVITSRAHARGLFEVVSGDDVEAMLNFEQYRQLAGCDNVGCLAEVGGALGVDLLLVSSIGQLGSSYVVNVKCIDIREARAVGGPVRRGLLDLLAARRHRRGDPPP